MKLIRIFFLFILSIIVLNPSLAALKEPVTDTYNGGRGVSFNDNWKFFKGDPTNAETPQFNDGLWTTLNVPHDWSIEQTFNQFSPAGSDGGYLEGGTGWYRKTFTVPSEYSKKRVTIQFEGVYMNSDVYVNGYFVGNRPYGYSSFEYDITPYLRFGGTNLIAVKVTHDQPSSRWYSGSGIYRNVWLTVTDLLYIDYCGTFVTTPSVSKNFATLNATTRIKNNNADGKTYTVMTSIFDDKNNLIDTKMSSPILMSANSERNFIFNYTLTNPNFWSLKNPRLYTLRTQLIEKDKISDSFTTNFGVRKIAMNPNTGFWLNDENIKLHGVCMHHDLGSLGAAQNYRALERQVEILKSFGVNAIRTSHNPPAPALLDICNKLGVMVLNEAFDCWEGTKKAFDYSNYFTEWAQKDIKDFVRRDRNNPSVIMWSIGNEIPEQNNSTGYRIAGNLMTWIRAEDPTRKITNGMNNGQHYVLGPILDVVGYNYDPASTYDSDHANYPDWLILGTETSSAVRTRGVYHLPTQTNILTSPDMQCSSYDNSVVGWGQRAEVSWEQDVTRPFVLGQFIWTGFDYIGEPTPYGWPAKSSYFGIVDMCGFPKDIYYFYQSQWTEKPMVHLLPHWNWESGATIPVWAYSNCDSVKIEVNGVAQKTEVMNKKSMPFHAEWLVPFQYGKIKAYAYMNGIVVATDSIETASAPSQISAKADRSTIWANGKDAAFIETDILDVKGTLVPDASNNVNFSISGPGKIVGVDNGNPISLESFKGTSREAFNGKCLAIVQSTGEEGQITLTATTDPVLKNLAFNKKTKADSEDIYELTNLALNKPSFSDSFQPDRPIYLGNDGNEGSRWCAIDGKAGHWWMVDLGEIYDVTSTEVLWEKSIAYKYIIETSIDNVTWVKRVDKSTNKTATQLMADKFTAKARYVRITYTSALSGAWASFYEFRVFDGSTSISANPKLASLANDDKENTYWSAADGNANHYWTVDLGQTYNLNQTEIMWQNTGIAYKYKIEFSTDENLWTMAVNKTSNTSTAQIQTDRFTPKPARYVKVTVTGGVTVDNKASIREFKAYDGSTTTLKSSTVIINAVKDTCVNCKSDSLYTTPWINLNETGWQQISTVDVKIGDKLMLSTLPADSTGWSWSGPRGFSANSAVLKFDNIQKADSGLYVATKGNIAVKFNVNTILTGLSSNKLNQPIIFPNPSNTGIFSIKNSAGVDLSVFTMNGKKIFSTFIVPDEYKLNLSHVESGVYIVRFSSGKSTSYNKVTIIK